MPRISANKLGEDLVSGPVRRRSIVTDQKHPPAFKATLYREAAGPVAEFLTARPFDQSAIDRAVVRLSSQRGGSDWQQTDRRNTADVLEAFMTLSSRLPADGIVYERAPDRPPP